MRFVSALVYFSLSTSGEDEAVEQKLREGLNICCTYLEDNLKHESISYTIEELVIDDEESAT